MNEDFEYNDDVTTEVVQQIIQERGVDLSKGNWRAVTERNADLRERVARAMKAANQMRLALAGQVRVDRAAYAWDEVAEDAFAALEAMTSTRKEKDHAET